MLQFWLYTPGNIFVNKTLQEAERCIYLNHNDNCILIMLGFFLSVGMMGFIVELGGIVRKCCIK